jgi:hypothetical protein
MEYDVCTMIQPQRTQGGTSQHIPKAPPVFGQVKTPMGARPRLMWIWRNQKLMDCRPLRHPSLSRKQEERQNDASRHDYDATA